MATYVLGLRAVSSSGFLDVRLLAVLHLFILCFFTFPISFQFLFPPPFNPHPLMMACSPRLSFY